MSSELCIQAQVSGVSLTLRILSVVHFHAAYQEANGPLIQTEPHVDTIYRLETPELYGDMSLVISTRDHLTLRINKGVPWYIKHENAINVRFGHERSFGIEEIRAGSTPVSMYSLLVGMEYGLELAMWDGVSVRVKGEGFTQIVSVK